MLMHLPDAIPFDVGAALTVQPLTGYSKLWKTQVIGLHGVTAQKPLCPKRYLYPGASAAFHQ
jgi:hypothetical protein